MVKLKFKEYFAPRAGHAYEWYTFNHMKQGEGESSGKFLTAATIQAICCNFGGLGDELLTYLIIAGIKSDDLREKLLSDASIDLQKQIDLCKANEQASHQLKDMVNHNLKAVDAVTTNTKKWKPRPQQRTTSEQTLQKECTYCGVTHPKEKLPRSGN